MEEKILELLKDMIKNKFKIGEEVRLNSHLKNDLNLDSIQFMEIINELEETFNLEISDEDLENPPETIEDMIQLGKGKLK